MDQIQDLVDVGQAFYPGQAFEAGAKAGLASRPRLASPSPTRNAAMKQHETTRFAKRSFQGTSPCIYTKRSVKKKNSVSDETHKLSKTDSTVFTFWTNPTENASAEPNSHPAMAPSRLFPTKAASREVSTSGPIPMTFGGRRGREWMGCWGLLG